MSDRPRNRLLQRTDPPPRRVDSPASSLRQVSSVRVNNERTPLIDPKTLANRGDDDVMSINYAGNGSSGPDYHASQPLSMEDLSWSEILPYYLPCLLWIPQYSWLYFGGDFLGGLTLVFFQIPLSLSYATTLAHVPILLGLFSLAILPLIYLIFGSVPQMVVGPEAPISLVVGQAVEPLLHHSKKHTRLDAIEYVVAITFVLGATLLGFGLGRFGFLDNVLSASLLKGFICGVGIVMCLNLSIVMMGLDKLMEQVRDDPEQMDIHSPFLKFVFLIRHWNHYHPLTLKISLAGFVVIMAIRIFKKRAERLKRLRPVWYYRLAVYIPEIMLVFVVSTYLCEQYRWDKEGIKVIGKVKNKGGLVLYNPFLKRILLLMKKLSTLGFLCAMLGFFESTTASKSLGSTYDLPISSNRELVALGSLNLVNLVFGALPAFGGYGRSKINAITAKTTMLSAIMGLLTLVAIVYCLDLFYFVPGCILLVISAVIGISLIEEVPHEVYFHICARGWSEIITFFITVTTTIFFSMEAGIAVGLVYLLIRVIRHLAKLRIQILARSPGTNMFADADLPTTGSYTSEGRGGTVQFLPDFFNDDNTTRLNKSLLEDIEGCLIVKIPEPLTFTNCADLRARLRRVEEFGSTTTHPALRRSRDASLTNYIIFDLNGMTGLDSLAARILVDLLDGYVARGLDVFFVRVTHHPKVRHRLVDIGVTDILKASLDRVNFYVRPSRLLVDSDTPDFSQLIELNKEPYFAHISDALKVIDNYEATNFPHASV